MPSHIDRDKFGSTKVYERRLSACACTGPVNNEPFCPCAMKSAGLKTDADYGWDEDTDERFRTAMAEMFGW